MDEKTLRKHLRSHGGAIVAGNMDRALEDFTDEVKPRTRGRSPIAAVPECR